MKNKLVLRLSNNLGNQMFMYASAYAISRRLDRELLIDNESSYMARNNFHKYNLNIFNFTSKIASNKYKYKDFYGYLIRKILKKIDIFKNKKRFYVEEKDRNKITYFNESYLKTSFASDIYMEGHFECEKYFTEFTNEIKQEFTFKNHNSFLSNKYYNDIRNSNSVCLCVRQNRFSEKKRNITKIDDEKSLVFTKDQIEYINKSINIINSKITNPKFFLWSNNLEDLKNYFPPNKFTHVSTNQIDLDLFLMTQAKHFVVIPSTFNWWGAWLNSYQKGIILRPSDKFFTNFTINNKNFWPKDWLVV